MDYNYSMLMSTAPDAPLLTDGDNDTYPALLLQSLRGENTRAEHGRHRALDAARSDSYLLDKLQQRTEN